MHSRYTMYKMCHYFQRIIALHLHIVNQETQKLFQVLTVKVPIFSKAQNSSQVHHNTSSAAHFRGLCVPTGFFCMTLQVDVVVPPMYFVNWTITFWLSSLIPRDHAPIVYFIPLLWVLCISEIAKIVDPGPWNSTSAVGPVAWITSSSSSWKHAPCSCGIKRAGSGECCL